MNENLLNKLDILKEAIENDPRVKRLNELEEKMDKNDDVMRLAYQKDVALTNFEDALKHFKEGSPEVQKAQKELYEAKKNLDTHPLVDEYRKAYNEVRKLYDEINKELFFDFSKSKRGCFND